MQLPETEIGSSGLYRDVEECTLSSPVLPLIGTTPLLDQKDMYKFMTLLPKDYYLIPGKLHHKTC